MKKQKRITAIEYTLAAYRRGYVSIPAEDLRRLVDELIALQTAAV